MFVFLTCLHVLKSDNLDENGDLLFHTRTVHDSLACCVEHSGMLSHPATYGR